MIKIKCLNKNQFFFVFLFFHICLQEKLHQKFSAFFKHFFFYKQIKKIGVEGFTAPIFFIYLYFIGVGGYENLKIYLAWPK